MIEERSTWVEWRSDPRSQCVNIDFLPSGGLEVYVDGSEAIIPADEVDAFLEALGALWLAHRAAR